MNKLQERLNDIIYYVDSQLSKDASKRINQIQDQEQEQSVSYIGALEDFIDGKKVNKERLKQDGRRIYEKLVESIGMISMVQAELQIKFNF